jgi:hypothetical protein
MQHVVELSAAKLHLSVLLSTLFAVKFVYNYSTGTSNQLSLGSVQYSCNIQNAPRILNLLNPIRKYKINLT